MSNLVPSWLAASVASTCFPIGISDERLPGVVSDGYDNFEKVKRIEGHFFVMSAKEDKMMPRIFAEKLAESHFGHLLEECCDDKKTVTFSVGAIKRRLQKLGVDITENLVETSKKPELRAMLSEVARSSDLNVLKARYLCDHQGDHGSFFGDDPLAVRKYRDYLREIGCLGRLDLAMIPVPMPSLGREIDVKTGVVFDLHNPLEGGLYHPFLLPETEQDYPNEGHHKKERHSKTSANDRCDLHTRGIDGESDEVAPGDDSERHRHRLATAAWLKNTV